jgi:septum formation protein
MKKLYLASTSPRRKELLKQIVGNNFSIISSDFEEDNELKVSPSRLAVINSRGKARAAAEKLKSGIVIGCDTFVWHEGFLGKPHTVAKARQTLKKISGKVVKIYSGLTVIDVDNNQEITDVAITKLYMKKLSKQEIDHYIAADNPLDNAGAFKIQEKGALLVERIGGCYNNVVGLPLFMLGQILTKMRVDLL